MVADGSVHAGAGTPTNALPLPPPVAAAGVTAAVDPWGPTPETNVQPVPGFLVPGQPLGGYPHGGQPAPAGWPPAAVAPPPRRWLRRLVLITAPALLVVAALVVLVVVRPWQRPTGPTKPTGAHSTLPISYAAGDNTGPAVRPAGAAHGGALTIMSDRGVNHLDPAQVFDLSEIAIGQLLYRTLTAVRTNPDGSGTLIGDLATDPGTDTAGDCTVWTYRLRQGLAYADGSPVTAADVAFGVARSFDPALAAGWSTLQQWLAGRSDYNADYHGPAAGAAPGVSTPDRTTIVFTLPQPHCDFPYATSLPATAPVPAGSHPSGAALDSRPPSSGPYQLTSKQSSRLELARNPHWLAASDPLRTADPDTISIRLNQDGADLTTQLIADADPDSLSWFSNTTAAARGTGRLLAGALGYTYYLHINTARVTDLKIRQAISYAIDKPAVIAASVGADNATVASTLIPAPLAGYQPATDRYPLNLSKAKELLAGAQPRLTLAIANTANRNKQAGVIKKNLTDAGFQVTIVPLASTDFYGDIAKPDDPYDLAIGNYYPPWPSGYQQLAIMYDSRASVLASNLSHLRDAGINAEFDRLDKVSAADQVAQAGALDAKILDSLAPAVPLYTGQGGFLRGSKVCGCPVSVVTGLPDVLTTFVTG